MRDCCNIFAAITTMAVTLPEMERYGLRLLVSLPLGLDLDDVRHYLVVVSGFSKVMRTTDMIFDALNDCLQRAGGRAYSVQLVGHYFEEV